MSTAGPQQQYLPPGDHRHEVEDVRPRSLFMFLLLLIASLIISGLFLAWYYSHLARRAQQADPPASPWADGDAPPAGPQLQVAPAASLHELRRKEQETLSSMQWISRTDGLVQIPIDRAIKLVAQRGLPQWPKVPPAARKPSGEMENGQ